jgi:hypothetical protein
VYPLFAATGVAVGICAFSLIRNITGNPEVRSVDPPLILIFATSDPFTQLILWNQVFRSSSLFFEMEQNNLNS